eukprot:764022-Hanusia_phi.AAC.7
MPSPPSSSPPSIASSLEAIGMQERKEPWQDSNLYCKTSQTAARTPPAHMLLLRLALRRPQREMLPVRRDVMEAEETVGEEREEGTAAISQLNHKFHLLLTCSFETRSAWSCALDPAVAALR